MKLVYEIENEELLRDFIKRQDISDKTLCKIKSCGDLKVNGKHVTVRYMLHKEDILEIFFPKETRGLQLEPSNQFLDIIYEDDYLLVINKQKNIPCIPNHRYQNNTLANVIINYYNNIGLESTVHFVNRLDRETQGLLIVAKYRHIHHLMSKKHIERKYLAIVENDFPYNELSINLPIARMGTSVKRTIHPSGKESITHIRKIKRLEKGTLVECQLETGRTHQIRVHLSSIGFPLIGDGLYGNRNDGGFYLKSYFLEFIHPIYLKKMKFSLES